MDRQFGELELQGLELTYQKIPVEYIVQQVPTPPPTQQPSSSLLQSFMPNIQLPPTRVAILTRAGVYNLLRFDMLVDPAQSYTYLTKAIAKFQIVLPFQLERNMLPVGPNAEYQQRNRVISNEVQQTLMADAQAAIEIQKRT
ncbi:hypothetical protein HDV00_009537, partial [Rhizophlyctis rosea]